MDAKHHLIVAHEVSNKGGDRHQLSNMGKQAKEAMAVDELTVVADRGYYRMQELLACEEAEIMPVVAKMRISGNQAKGQFGRDDFHYIAEDDEYQCPAGERLIYRTSSQEQGLILHRYWSSACPSCAMHAKCTNGKYRRMTRW